MHILSVVSILIYRYILVTIVPDILESCIRVALQLIIQWKTAVSQPLQETKSFGSTPATPTIL